MIMIMIIAMIVMIVLIGSAVAVAAVVVVFEGLGRLEVSRRGSVHRRSQPCWL